MEDDIKPITFLYSGNTYNTPRSKAAWYMERKFSDYTDNILRKDRYATCANIITAWPDIWKDVNNLFGLKMFIMLSEEPEQVKQAVNKLFLIG